MVFIDYDMCDHGLLDEMTRHNCSQYPKNQCEIQNRLLRQTPDTSYIYACVIHLYSSPSR